LAEQQASSRDHNDCRQRLRKLTADQASTIDELKARLHEQQLAALQHESTMREKLSTLERAVKESAQVATEARSARDDTQEVAQPHTYHIVTTCWHAEGSPMLAACSSLCHNSLPYHTNCSADSGLLHRWWAAWNFISRLRMSK